MTNFDEFRSIIMSRLSYNPDTGVFTRIAAVGRHVRHVAGKAVGSPHSCGYLSTMIDGKNYMLHRLAFVMMGVDPTGVVDHINGNPMDNRFKNLRLVSQALNCRNAKMSKSNTSGHMGVVWNRSKSVWQAQIMVDRRNIHLGKFSEKADAIAARKAAEAAHGFHENHGRKQCS